MEPEIKSEVVPLSQIPSRDIVSRWEPQISEALGLKANTALKLSGFPKSAALAMQSLVRGRKLPLIVYRRGPEIYILRMPASRKGASAPKNGGTNGSRADKNLQVPAMRSGQGRR